MPPVTRKRRRADRNTQYYSDSDDNDEQEPAKRGSNTSHQYTSFKTTNTGVSTRTSVVATRRDIPARLTDAEDILQDRAEADPSQFDDQEGPVNVHWDPEHPDGDLEPFETLYPELFTDIGEYLQVHKTRKRTANVRINMPISLCDHFLYIYRIILFENGRRTRSMSGLLSFFDTRAEGTSHKTPAPAATTDFHNIVVMTAGTLDFTVTSVREECIAATHSIG